MENKFLLMSILTIIHLIGRNRHIYQEILYFCLDKLVGHIPIEISGIMD